MENTFLKVSLEAQPTVAHKSFLILAYFQPHVSYRHVSCKTPVTAESLCCDCENL